MSEVAELFARLPHKPSSAFHAPPAAAAPSPLFNDQSSPAGSRRGQSAVSASTLGRTPASPKGQERDEDAMQPS